MSRFGVWVAVVLVALAAVGSAGAAGKERVVVDHFVEPYAFAVSCAPYGPYTFDNLVSGREHVRVTEVLAKDGALLQLVLDIQFQETNVNSETGKELTLKGAVHEVWDFTSNTRTISGKVFLGTGEGGGTWVQDTGRITMTLDTKEPRFVGGPHEAFFGGGIDVLACAALASG
jgi:hypothetical protein